MIKDALKGTVKVLIFMAVLIGLASSLIPVADKPAKGAELIGEGVLHYALVVSSEAPEIIKQQAWEAKEVYGEFIQIADGTDDQVEINAAIAAYSTAPPFTQLADPGGIVHLTKGRFFLSDYIYLYYVTTTLEGEGLGTRLVATREGMANLIIVAEQTVLRDFVTDGNGKHPQNHIWLSSAPDIRLHEIQSMGGATQAYIYGGGHVPKRLSIRGFRARTNPEGYQIMLTQAWMEAALLSITESFFDRRAASSPNYNIYIQNYDGILIALNQFEDLEDSYPYQAIKLDNSQNIVKGLNTFGTRIRY